MEQWQQGRLPARTGKPMTGRYETASNRFGSGLDPEADGLLRLWAFLCIQLKEI